MTHLARPGHRLLLVASSDFHLGDGSPRDDVGAAACERLARETVELAPLVALHLAEVALVGDVLDAWRYRLRDCVAAHLHELSLLASLAPRPSRQSVRWILGNHDEAVRLAHLPRRTWFEMTRHAELAGYHVEHGDAYDPAPDLLRRAGIAGCRALAWVGRRIGPGVEDDLSEAAGRLEGAGRWGDGDRYRRLATQGGRRRAILGHTHRAVVAPGYVNLGTWAKDGWTLLWDDGVVTRWRL